MKLSAASRYSRLFYLYKTAAEYGAVFNIINFYLSSGKGVFVTEWESRERAKQLIAFDNMTYSDTNARPMDIDLAMDARRGEVFVLGEIKYNGKEVPTGQRWFLFNFIKAIRASGKHAIAMILDHEVRDANEDVQAANCKVREYITTETIRFGWSVPKRNYTCDEMIKDYLKLTDPIVPF